MLGTSPQRTRGGTRYYDISDLAALSPDVVADDAVTVCYAWVSGSGQDAELERNRP